MKERQESQFRLMTYNIGGALEEDGSALDSVIKVVEEVAPDILIVQEAAEFQDADGVWHSALGQIAQAVEFGESLPRADYFPARAHARAKAHIRSRHL